MIPDPFLQKSSAEEWELQGDMGYTPQENPVGGFSLLTITSKMMAFSFGIPYKQSCPGQQASIDRPRGICRLCYAAGGNYQYPNVRSTMGKRLALTRRPEQFLATMTDAFSRPWSYNRGPSNKLPPDFRQLILDTLPGNFFRIHDSGDFWSPQYAMAWYEVCRAHPDTFFWAPTRVWAAKDSWRSPVDGKTYRKRDLLTALDHLASLDNVALRPSELSFDTFPTTRVHDWSAASGAITLKTVHLSVGGRSTTVKPVVPPQQISRDGRWWRNPRTRKEAFICPAAMAASPRHNCLTTFGPDGKKPCRVCWLDPNLNVVYPTH